MLECGIFIVPEIVIITLVLLFLKRKERGAKKNLSLLIHGKPVIITAAVGIDVEDVIASPRFRSWVERLEAGLLVTSIHFQSVDFFGSKVGFIKMQVTATDPDEVPLPGIVFLRGDSVTVFVVLECEGREYAAFAAQARVAVGQLHFMEIAGGMCDKDGTFTGQAALELQQELGLRIHRKDLVDLVATASQGRVQSLFPSHGACDEALAVLLYRTSISREALDHLNGRQGGVHEEGERTHVRIVPLEAIFSVSRNETAWLAYLLYEDRKRRGL